MAITACGAPFVEAASCPKTIVELYWNAIKAKVLLDAESTYNVTRLQ